MRFLSTIISLRQIGNYFSKILSSITLISLERVVRIVHLHHLICLTPEMNFIYGRPWGSHSVWKNFDRDFRKLYLFTGSNNYKLKTSQKYVEYAYLENKSNKFKYGIGEGNKQPISYSVFSAKKALSTYGAHYVSRPKIKV